MKGFQKENLPNTKRKFSEEHKKKISIAVSISRKKLFKDGKLKTWNKGRTGIYSLEVRKKISIASKINSHGEKNGMFGRHHSEESKKKISISALLRNEELIQMSLEDRKARDRKIHREWKKKYIDKDIQHKLSARLRSRIYSAVKGNRNSGSAVKDLGCTILELKSYLENKFTEGMTWKNWGHCGMFWHIDHIVPLDSFDLTDRKQFLQACHYTNLQPMWEVDNIRKKNKVLAPL